jgi:hypothetical protein
MVAAAARYSTRNPANFADLRSGEMVAAFLLVANHISKPKLTLIELG